MRNETKNSKHPFRAVGAATFWIACSVTFAGGCAGDVAADGPLLSVNTPDAGFDTSSLDASSLDTSSLDTSSLDTLTGGDDTTPDTKPNDAAGSDTASPDTTTPDTTTPDTTSLDTTTSDTTGADGSSGDVAPLTDAAVSDAANNTDAGLLGDGGAGDPDGDNAGDSAVSPDSSGADDGAIVVKTCVGQDPAVACDDGSQCTLDGCKDGVCVYEDTSKACDDGNECTDSSCDPKEGCVKLPNAVTCSDDDACTVGDQCAKSTCTAGPLATCNDGNPCTADSCKSGPASKGGGCVHVPTTGDCEDGNKCTENDACASGACKPGPLKSCDDTNVCTSDSCDTDGTCAHLSNDESCDDGDKCTAADQCAAGKCAGGKQVDCDDGNPCTKSSCAVNLGCEVTAVAGLCDDGDGCTEGDQCADGKCVSGSKKTCDDQNGCTSDACVNDKCSHIANEAPCDDGNPCTEADTCSTGSCAPGKQPKSCSDSNPCTADTCDPKTVGGCVSMPQKATCDDGSVCTTGDACDKGVCVGTGGVDCDDNDPCTDDSCKPGSASKDGCVHSHNTAKCEDGNKCTEGDACKSGKCVSGASPNCDDANACTLGDCLPETGCTQTAIPGVCSDGTVCTAGDACKSGKCVAGPAKDCDDKDICTDDACHPKLGCQAKLNTAPCEDGNKCTADDKCSEGICTPGTKVVCQDNNSCTSDSCQAAKGCVYAEKPGIVVPKCDGTIHNGKCIRAQAKTYNQTQAQAACKTWGGQLVSIANKAENDVVLAEAKARCGTGWAWIGMHDTQKEGVYQWYDQSKVTYSNWNSGEPNNYGGKEDAIHIMDSGKWNDHQIGTKLNCYVCKRSLPVACNDGDACTTGEVCTTGGKCTPAVSSCDDHNSCTVDTCDKSKGCAHKVQADGTACGSGICASGKCVIGTDKQPAKSCQELVGNIGLQPANGVYWLDPDGSGAVPKFRTFCAFNPGIGWTLAMKINGASTTLRYSSSYWTDSKGLNTNSVNFDTNEAKLASFWTMPFTTVLVSMKVGSTYKWLAVPQKATSLRALFATNKPQPTKLGRGAWLGLIGGSSLQPHCNAEGFNIGDSGAQVRIGIIGNNENDCNSPDSRLGFGGRGNRCGQDTNNSCGNTARCGGHAGNKNTKVFGYVFVR